jgi:proline-specific peptidase
MKEGYLQFRDSKTYYKLFGGRSETATPIVVLQGGPGVSHHYMLGLRKLATAKQQVIFYDQYGSGQSGGWSDADAWTMPTFIDQLNAVRDELKLPEVHLVGHSFGGMLAIDYVLSRPQGVKSVILSSTMISMPLYQQEVDKLVEALPASARQVIKRCHHNGDVKSNNFKDAFKEFDKRHTFRGDSWPQELSAPVGSRNEHLYRDLWGLSEAHTTTGRLCDWDRIEQLSRISLPTLITSGQYDELTPMQAELTHQKISGSKLKVFEDCSHCHHVENQQLYLSEASNFLNNVMA